MTCSCKQNISFRDERSFIIKQRKWNFRNPVYTLKKKNIFFLFKHDKFLSNLQHYPKVFFPGKIMSNFYPHRIAMKKKIIKY